MKFAYIKYKTFIIFSLLLNYGHFSERFIKSWLLHGHFTIFHGDHQRKINFCHDPRSIVHGINWNNPQISITVKYTTTRNKKIKTLSIYSNKIPLSETFFIKWYLWAHLESHKNFHKFLFNNNIRECWCCRLFLALWVQLLFFFVKYFYYRHYTVVEKIKIVIFWMNKKIICEGVENGLCSTFNIVSINIEKVHFQYYSHFIWNVSNSTLFSKFSNIQSCFIFHFVLTFINSWILPHPSLVKKKNSQPIAIMWRIWGQLCLLTQNLFLKCPHHIT